MKEFQKYEIKIKKEDGVQSLVIEKPTFVIGRSVGADVSLKHELVSREHLRVTVKGEDFFIEDLGSSNGTWVDGVKLEAKKSLICNSSSVIIIGKSLGPTISINCFFKEKSQVLNEDVTLINAANVVSLQPKVAKVQSYAEIEMPKVANGYSYATPSARPQKLQEEPSALIIQMKNLLESEVEKAKRLAISEAEEIIAQAKYEAEKIRFDANEAAGNVTARANLEIERIKASNLKDSNTLLAGAKRESEDMLQTAAAEVSNLRANAQKFSDDLLDKAREKSKQLIEDTERNVKEKLSECKAVEEEKIHNVQELKATYTDLKSKVDTLKMIEKNTQLNYESLTKTMRLDEERMFNERTNLESLRAELSMAKKESEQRVAELKLEERNIKAQIETTILESKLQVTQGQTEIKHIEVVKATLSHEMVSIKNEKEKVALQISELESRYREESQRIRDIEASRERAQNELNKAKEEEKQVTLEVEKKKEDMKKSFEDLIQKEKEAEAKIEKAQVFFDEMTEGIKKEREAFEVKREELLAEFQEEKKIQQKLINEEVQKYKALQDEELQKIKEKHLKAQKEAEKTHIQSLQGLEKMIVKSREDFQTFQKALKDDADKMKIEANTEMLQVKNRLENATGQLNKEHEQVKKNLAFEIESMVVLKKRVEQELKSLEESRKDKMTRADSEAKELISEAKKQSESIMNKLEAEKEKEKVSLLQLKEKEMAEIEEMKKSALKDIYGKKTERAKDVVTNVIAVMLTELNKVRNKRLSDELIEECTNEVSEIVYNTVMGTASVDKLKFDSAVKERVKAKKGWVELRNQLKMVGIAALGIIFLISLPSLLALPEVAQLKSFISSLLNP